VGSVGIAPRILNPGSFTVGVKAPGTHLIGNCVGPRAGLNAVGKGEAVVLILK